MRQKKGPENEASSTPFNLSTLQYQNQILNLQVEQLRRQIQKHPTFEDAQYFTQIISLLTDQDAIGLATRIKQQTDFSFASLVSIYENEFSTGSDQVAMEEENQQKQLIQSTLKFIIDYQKLKFPQLINNRYTHDLGEIQQENQRLRRENDHLQRRIRTLCNYNAAGIQKNVESSQQILKQYVSLEYDCVCGSAQYHIQNQLIMKDFEEEYNKFVRSAFPMVFIIVYQMTEETSALKIESITQVEKQEEAKLTKNESQINETASETLKQIIEAFAEEKSQLIKTIEEQKITLKIPDEQVIQSHLYQELSDQNVQLVQFLHTQEKYIRQLEEQVENEIQKSMEMQLKIREEYQQSFEKDLQKPTLAHRNSEIVETQRIFERQDRVLQEKIQIQQKCEDDMRNELGLVRQRNQVITAQLEREQQKRTEMQAAIQNLQAEINGYKTSRLNESLEPLIFRYEKHRAMLIEIETEYAQPKGQEYLLKFKELAGYIKMRDDKVKGLEHQIESKNQELVQFKKQMESIFEELNCNSQVYNSQMDKNKELSRLLDEVQKNESRVIQDRYNEKQRFENTLNDLQTKLQTSDEIQRNLRNQNEQLKQMQKLNDQDRSQQKNQVEQLRKQLTEHKSMLIEQDNQLITLRQQLEVFNQKQNLSEFINQKYIKAAEQSKAKHKALKLQFKNQLSNRLNSSDYEADLVQSLKMMVNCQQCKKKLKEQILVKCLHMFCKGCLDDNMKNRNRACSICRTRFGLEDVKSIKMT